MRRFPARPRDRIDALEQHARSVDVFVAEQRFAMRQAAKGLTNTSNGRIVRRDPASREQLAVMQAEIDRALSVQAYCRAEASRLIEQGVRSV